MVTASNMATGASVPLTGTLPEGEPASQPYDLSVMGVCFTTTNYFPYFIIYPCAEKTIHDYDFPKDGLDNPSIIQDAGPFASATPTAGAGD